MRVKGYGPHAGVVAGLAAATMIAFSLLAAGAGASLLAPRSECAGQANVKAPEPVQEEAMRCLINHARDEAGVGSLDSNRSLERAAGRKVGDVSSCGFSHTACGKPFDLYPDRFGYTSASSYQLGENLGRGPGKRGTARKTVKGWLNSPPHHETMLGAAYEDLGIGLRRNGREAVWVLQVGCRGC